MINFKKIKSSLTFSLFNTLVCILLELNLLVIIFKLQLGYVQIIDVVDDLAIILILWAICSRDFITKRLDKIEKKIADIKKEDTPSE